MSDVRRQTSDVRCQIQGSICGRESIENPKSKIQNGMICPRQDSNLQPTDYESAALTVELQGLKSCFSLPKTRFGNNSAVGSISTELRLRWIQVVSCCPNTVCCWSIFLIVGLFRVFGVIRGSTRNPIIRFHSPKERQRRNVRCPFVIRWIGHQLSYLNASTMET